MTAYMKQNAFGRQRVAFARGSQTEVKKHGIRACKVVEKADIADVRLRIQSNSSCSNLPKEKKKKQKSSASP